MWSLVGVVLAFIVMIVLIRRKVNFGLALFVGSAVVAAFGLLSVHPIDIGKALAEATVYSFERNEPVLETVELAVLLTLIYMLAKTMQQTGAIARLIDSLRTYLTKGGTIGVIPAVYGLLPVPGGALFSAPLIDKEGDLYQLSSDRKNFLNVWFRHIWFPIYPISAAMILVCSASFANIDIKWLMLADIPAFCAFIVIGWVALRLSLTPPKEPALVRTRDASGLVFLLPLLLPLLFYFALDWTGLSENEIFLPGVLASILAVNLFLHRPWSEYLGVVRQSFTWTLVLAVFGIMVFREMVTVSGAHLVLADLMGSLAVPAVLVIIILPMILGIVTGYNLGAIALSYALVEPFFAVTGLSLVGLTSLLFISSLAGYLISPIHLCNVLSSEYLKTDTTRMYRYYIPATLLLLAVQTVAVLLFFS